MPSDSAFISPTDFTNHFSNITLQEERKHNVIYTAQRYGRTFILKTLKAEYANISEYQLAQEKEFRLGISLNHPNIAITYSFEKVPDIGRCIVEEYIDGVTLKEWLKDTAQSKISARHRILSQLLDALEYLHSTQKVHHDLKSSNILITRNGQNLKLIDFGLSDTDDSTTTATNDPKNDIIALGNIIALIFPHRYKRIARHCQQGKYETISSIRTAIQRADRRRRTLPLLSILPLVIFATFAFAHYYSPLQQPTITFEQIDQHLQSVYDSLSAIALPERETIVMPPIVKQQTIFEHKTDTVHVVHSTLSYDYADIEQMQQALIQPYYDSLSTPVGQYREMAIQWLNDYYTVQLQVRDSILQADFEKGSIDYQLFQNAWLSACTSLATAFHDSIRRMPSISVEYAKGNLSLAECDSLNAIWQQKILEKQQ